MKLVRRSLTVLLGYAAAVIAACVIPIGVVLASALAVGHGDRIPFGLKLIAFTLVQNGFWLLPPLLVIAIAEVLCIQSILAHVTLGVVIVVGLAFYSGSMHIDGPTYLPYNIGVPAITAAAGVVAGLVYWRLAGRNAGAWPKNESPS